MNYGKAMKYATVCVRRGGAAGLVNMARGYATLRREPEVVRYHPLSLIIEPTLRCNLNCLMCDRSLRGRTAEQLTLDKFKTVVAQFPFTQKLAIQGVGEPLMNPEFFDMVAHAKSKNIYVYFNTNACLLDEAKLDKLLAARPDEVRVSVDGATKETYERYRRGGDFDEVIANLTRFAGRAPAGISIAVWFLAMKENIQEMPLMPALAARAGVRRLFVQNLHSWGRESLKKEVVADLGIRRGEYMETIEKTRANAVAAGVELLLATDFSGEQKTRGCQWPWFSAYISVEGFVTPCCVQGSNPDIINFGNIFERPFAEIWNNEEYRKFRADLKSDNPPKICRGCPAYYTKILT